MIDTIIYLRKSREDVGKEDTLDNHRRILTDLCNKNNWNYKAYEEIANSDSMEDRTEIQKVLKEIKAGKCKRIVVMAIDRLSRNKVDSAYIEDVLIEYNIELITPSKSYNWSNESDLMLSDFDQLLARQEYRMIKKRMALGKKASAEKGKLTSGEPPLGYVMDKNKKKVVIDQERAKAYRWLVDEYLTGNYSTHTLSYEFNKRFTGNRGAKANNARIHKILKNKFYLGYVKYKGEWYKGEHEPLIEEEEYNKILELLAGKSKIPRRKGYKKIKNTTGICKCALCGHTMSVTTDNNRNYLRCWYVDTEGNRCKNKRVSEELIIKELDKRIMAEISEMESFLNGEDKIHVDSKLKAIQKELEVLEGKYKQLELKESNIKNLAIEGILSVSEVKEQMKKLQFEKLEIDERIGINKYFYRINNVDVEEKLEDLKGIYENLKDNLGQDERNHLYKQLVNKIELTKLDKDNIKINIVFL